MKKTIYLLCLLVITATFSACDDTAPTPEPPDTSYQSTSLTEAPDTEAQTNASTEAPITVLQTNPSTEPPVTVPPTAETTQAPDINSLRFKLQPQSVTVKEGETATFKVEAEGGKKPYNYMWLTSYFDGEIIANQETQTDTISFPNVGINFNGATYFCRVTDANNTMIQSEKVTISVKPKYEKKQ